MEIALDHKNNLDKDNKFVDRQESCYHLPQSNVAFVFYVNKLCHRVYSSNHTHIWIHLNLCVHLLQSHLQSSSWRSLRHFAAFDLYVSCSFFQHEMHISFQNIHLEKNVPKFYKIMFRICSCVKKRSIYEIIFFCIW